MVRSAHRRALGLLETRQLNAEGPIGTYYQRLLRAKGKAKATVAAARKLCCYLDWMLKEGWSHEAWLRQHVRSSPSEVRPIQRTGAVAQQDPATSPVTRMGHLPRTVLLSPRT
jgi:hypothetical protein